MPGSGTTVYSLGSALLHLYDNNGYEVHRGFGEQETISGRLPFAPTGPPIVSPEGTFLCLTDTNGISSIWSTRVGGRVSVLEGTRNSFEVFRAFSPDEKRIAGFSQASQSRVVWNVADGSLVAKRESELLHGQSWVDKRTLMISSSNRDRWLWDVTSDTIRGPFNQPGGIQSGISSPDGRMVATVGKHSVVKVWDARTLDGLHTFERGTQLAGFHTLAPFDFSTDSKRLIVVAGHAAPRIYDTATWQEVGTLEVGFTPSWCKFSEDGRWLGLAGMGVKGTRPGSVHLEAPTLEELDQ
jgi:WD40 repeat protein